MPRAAATLTLALFVLLCAPAWAQTGTAPDPGRAAPSSYPPEPSYEAETPLLLGTFLEPSGGSGAAEDKAGAMPRPITIVTDPLRKPEVPRIEPIMSARPEK